MTGRVAAAAGTATVVAGSLAVAGAAGAFGSASRAPVQTTYTAYVITHVEHALAAPRIGNLVEADRTVFSPGSTLQPFPDALVGSAGGTGSSSPWRAGYTLRWIYHGSIELSSFTASGQRVFDWAHHPGARNHRGDLRERHLVDRAAASMARAGAALRPAASGATRLPSAGARATAGRPSSGPSWPAARTRWRAGR